MRKRRRPVTIHTPPPGLDERQQIEWCYQEYQPGQQQWRKWARQMKAEGRGREVPR